MSENTQYGGPQMVKIDGARVRQFREQRGLTQLYVATVVDVTTDTISRWENRRYPSIKQENAEKLAEALQVNLEEILDLPDEGQTEAQTSTPEPVINDGEKSFTPWAYAIVLMALVILGTVFVMKKTPDLVLPTITAKRILPPHVPAGQAFPVLIKVTSSLPQPVSIVLRETVPHGGRVQRSEPSVSTISKDHRLVKWITKINKEKTFAYLARNPDTSSPQSEIQFSGQILPVSGETIVISGHKSVRTRNFHWADVNMDLRIDDEEILAVYDIFDDISGFQFKNDQLDELWAAESYSYDLSSKRYKPGQ